MPTDPHQQRLRPRSREVLREASGSDIQLADTPALRHLHFSRQLQAGRRQQRRPTTGVNAFWPFNETASNSNYNRSYHSSRQWLA